MGLADPAEQVRPQSGAMLFVAASKQDIQHTHNTHQREQVHCILAQTCHLKQVSVARLHFNMTLQIPGASLLSMILHLWKPEGNASACAVLNLAYLVVVARLCTSSVRKCLFIVTACRAFCVLCFVTDALVSLHVQ
jgi:hypothetical protein